MPRTRKPDEGQVQEYKVIGDGIWIPKRELERLRDVFKAVYVKLNTSGMPFNTEGHRRMHKLYGQLVELVEKGEDSK